MTAFRTGRVQLGLVLIVLAVGMCAPAFLHVKGPPDRLAALPTAPSRVDVAVVLGGDPSRRAPLAAELLKRGAAHWILVTGAGDCMANRRSLIDQGVPAAAVMLECKARNTDENARFSVPLLRALGARTAAVVSSVYHTRRALLSFRHYAPDMVFSPLGNDSGQSVQPRTFRARWNTAGELERTLWYTLMYRLDIRPHF